eukprot:gene6321-12791_t
MDALKDKKTKIKWDEDVIQEHNKERGTRQKIDEPPTPYRYGSDSELSTSEHENETESTEKIHVSPKSTTGFKLNEIKDHWENIHAKLNYHEQLQQDPNYKPNSKDEPNLLSIPYSEHDKKSSKISNSNHHIDHSNSIPEKEISEHETDDQFKEKRAAHYNEYKILKAMKLKMQQQEEDDENADNEEGFDT